MKDFIESHEIAVIIAIVALFAVLAIAFNVTAWNDGVCNKCGGRYEYTDTYTTFHQSRRSRRLEQSSTTHYQFTCSSCGHMITLAYNPLWY